MGIWLLSVAAGISADCRNFGFHVQDSRACKAGTGDGHRPPGHGKHVLCLHKCINNIQVQAGETCAS